MASVNTPNFPFHPSPPPPSPPPPSPTPDNNPTVVVIVFISLGGVLFFAFIAVALCCFIKKKKKKTTNETDIIHVDKQRKVKEDVVLGPFGRDTLVLTIEDDLHIDEVIRKNEERFGKGLKGKHEEGNPSSLEMTSASSSSNQAHVEDKI